MYTDLIMLKQKRMSNLELESKIHLEISNKHNGIIINSNKTNNPFGGDYTKSLSELNESNQSNELELVDNSINSWFSSNKTSPHQEVFKSFLFCKDSDEEYDNNSDNSLSSQTTKSTFQFKYKRDTNFLADENQLVENYECERNDKNAVETSESKFILKSNDHKSVNNSIKLDCNNINKSDLYTPVNSPIKPTLKNRINSNDLSKSLCLNFVNYMKM